MHQNNAYLQVLFFAPIEFGLSWKATSETAFARSLSLALQRQAIIVLRKLHLPLRY